MIQHASIDDSTLFERITRHDAEAFGIVMRRYTGALFCIQDRGRYVGCRRYCTGSIYQPLGKKTETIPRPIPT